MLWSLLSVLIFAGSFSSAQVLRCESVLHFSGYETISMLSEYRHQDPNLLGAVYLDARHREDFHVHVVQGVLQWSDGSVVDTKDSLQDVVMDRDGNIFTEDVRSPVDKKHFFHSSFLSGAPTAFAGMFKVRNGIEPPPNMLLQFRDELNKKSAPVAQIKFYDFNFKPLYLDCLDGLACLNSSILGATEFHIQVHALNLIRSLDIEVVNRMSVLKQRRLFTIVANEIHEGLSDEEIRNRLSGGP
jgi:hypothetical protein